MGSSDAGSTVSPHLASNKYQSQHIKVHDTNSYQKCESSQFTTAGFPKHQTVSQPEISSAERDHSDFNEDRFASQFLAGQESSIFSSYDTKRKNQLSALSRNSPGRGGGSQMSAQHIRHKLRNDKNIIGTNGVVKRKIEEHEEIRIKYAREAKEIADNKNFFRVSNKSLLAQSIIMRDRLQKLPRINGKSQ